MLDLRNKRRDLNRQGAKWRKEEIGDWRSILKTTENIEHRRHEDGVGGSWHCVRARRGQEISPARVSALWMTDGASIEPASTKRSISG